MLARATSTMEDAADASRSGVREGRRNALHAETAADGMYANGHKADILKRGTLRDPGVVRSRKRSRFFLGRRPGPSTPPGIFLAAAAASGLLLVSSVTVRLIACFKASVSPGATSREVFTGVTSRWLAGRHDDVRLSSIPARGGSSRSRLATAPALLSERTSFRPSVGEECLGGPFAELLSELHTKVRRPLTFSSTTPAQKTLPATTSNPNPAALTPNTAKLPVPTTPTGENPPRSIEHLGRSRALMPRWLAQLTVPAVLVGVGVSIALVDLGLFLAVWLYNGFGKQIGLKIAVCAFSAVGVAALIVAGVLAGAMALRLRARSEPVTEKAQKTGDSSEDAVIEIVHQ